jgi:hypothetical protein
MTNVEAVQAIYEAFGRGDVLWTFGEDGKVTRFFHCIDRHAFVLACGL